VQLNATTASGEAVSLASDTTWRCQTSSSENIGGIKYKDHSGEKIDARKKVTGGLLQNYDKHWGKFPGDWAAPEQRKERGDSPEAEFFNNRVYAMNPNDFVEIARILQRPADAALYGRRLEELKSRVHAKFFKPRENSDCNGTQVQLAFALLTGITPKTLRPAVGATLRKELDSKTYLDMGSSGLPVLLKYLIERSDAAGTLYQHLARTTEPSYGHFISRGDSTWPEYWNVDVPSRIHTCYTGIASWVTKRHMPHQRRPS
jgi:alpha-L-rhamnosidase